MRRPWRRSALGSILAAALLIFEPSAMRESVAAQIPEELQGVGIVEELGAQVPLKELTFKNEEGKDTALAEYFGKGKPVILSLVYFECPNLCNFLLNGTVDTMKTLKQFQLGTQYDFVTISIDPKETPTLAAKKKAAYLQSLGRPDAGDAWHFLTGSQEQIQRLASTVGFKYKWHEPSKQFAHAAGLFLLTPDGRLSRVLHGVSFKERDLKFGLIEASEGKIGTVVDRIVMFCFQYSTAQRGYIPYIFRFVQMASLLMAIVVLSAVGRFWFRERRSERKGAASSC